VNQLGQLSQYLGGVTDNVGEIVNEVEENLPAMHKYAASAISIVKQYRAKLTEQASGEQRPIAPRQEPDMSERIGATLSKIAPELQVGVKTGGTVLVVGGLGVAALGAWRKSTMLTLAGLGVALLGGIGAGAASK
jgi:hypothetical protein